MAHFLLTPVGSSGDVYPFIGIGRALRGRGHDVTIITSEPFRHASERARLRFVQAQSVAEFDAMTRHPDLWHGRKGIALILGAVAASLNSHYELIRGAYDPGRTVLVGHAIAFAARIFEDAHRIPAATLHLAPSILRSDFQQPAAIPGVDSSALPGWVKRTTMWAIDRWLLDPPILPALNALRTELGLEPVSRVFKKWLHSPQRVVGLFPEWFAPIQPDWPPQLRLTGFPLYDDADASPLAADLEMFLERGSPPILFTAGTANRAAATFFSEALAAVRRLGRRALFLTAYPEQLPPGLDSDVRHASYVPFSKILPRCAAVVHHGGIGTCAQGLLAGVPQLVMPLAFDQPDNATRLWRLGVSRWIRPHLFTADRVASALTALLDDERIADRCRHWAAELRRVDSVAAVCATLEALVPSAHDGAPTETQHVLFRRS